MPLVSIIIPAYNAQRFLHEAIDSALSQTYREVEVVVCDDGSEDDTPRIVQSYGDKVIHIRQSNQGVGVARNTAIAASRGEYLAFLDADDVWLPEKLERQMPLFGDHEVALVYTDCYFTDVNGRILMRSFERIAPYRGNVFDQLMEENFVPLQTAVIRRSAFDEVGGFQPYWVAEDFDLFLKIGYLYPFDYVDAPLAKYRQHEGNFMRKLDYVFRESLEIRSHWSDRFTAAADQRANRVRVLVAISHIEYGLWLGRQRRWNEARRQISHAFAKSEPPRKSLASTMKLLTAYGRAKLTRKSASIRLRWQQRGGAEKLG